MTSPIFNLCTFDSDSFLFLSLLFYVCVCACRCLSNVATCHSKWTKTPVKKDGLGVSNWKEVMKNCDQAVWVHDGGKVNDDRLLSKILYRRAEVWLHKSETTKVCVCVCVFLPKVFF